MSRRHGSARERRTECRCRHCRFLRVALALSDLINCPRSRGGFPANGSYGVRAPLSLHFQPPQTSLVSPIRFGIRCGCPPRSHRVAELSLAERLIFATARPPSDRPADTLQSGSDLGCPVQFRGIAKKMWVKLWDRRGIQRTAIGGRQMVSTVTCLGSPRLPSWTGIR